METILLKLHGHALKYFSQCLEDLQPIKEFPGIPVDQLDVCKDKTSYKRLMGYTKVIEDKWNAHLKSIKKGECCGKILELIWDIQKTNRKVVPKIEDSELPAEMRTSEYKEQYKVLMSIDKHMKSSSQSSDVKEATVKRTDDETSRILTGSVESVSKTSKSSSETDGSETKSIGMEEYRIKVFDFIEKIRKSNRGVLKKVKDAELPNDLRDSEYNKHYKYLMSIDNYLKSTATATQMKQGPSKKHPTSEDSTTTGGVDTAIDTEQLAMTVSKEDQTETDKTEKRKVLNYERLLVEIWSLKKEHVEVIKRPDESEIPEELKSSECLKHFKVLIAVNNVLKSINSQEESIQHLQKTIEELKEKLDSKEVEVKTKQHIKSEGNNSTGSDPSSSAASVDIGTQQDPTMTVRSTEVRPQTDITEESKNYQRLLGEIMSLKENHKHLLKNLDLSASPDDLTNKECSTHFDVLVSINNFLKSMDVQKKDQESFVAEMVNKLTKVLHENQKLLEDNEKMKTDIERYTSKKPTQEIKKLISEIDALKKSLKNEEKEREKLKITIQAKEKDIHLLNQKLQMQRPQTAPVSYAKEYKEMSKQVENLKAEKESLMQRLSMVAGRKMKDNNPSIADLSDPNRPERLGEQFREIYDNAWTDVLDHLTENKDVTDEVAVKKIVNVLQAIHNQCKDQMKGKKQSIIKIIGYPEDTLERQYTGGKEGHDPTVKIIKDLVQASANRISAEVIQEIKKCPVVEDILRMGGGKSEIFVTKCSLLCLFMVVQDPPVVLDFSCQPGDPFNKDMFTPFTSSGEVVDYLVWPVMYLSQGGAIMSKGIAQGKKTIKQKQDEDNSN